MTYLFDTSALAKRYLIEDGREQVVALFAQADEIGVGSFWFAEVISAFCRLRRENNLTKQEYERIKSEVLEDFEDFSIVSITTATNEKAAELLEGNIQRGMDALHVACAIVWYADVFVSGDHRQVLAAKHAGLNVIEV